MKKSVVHCLVFFLFLAQLSTLLALSSPTQAQAASARADGYIAICTGSGVKTIKLDGTEAPRNGGAYADHCLDCRLTSFAFSLPDRRDFLTDFVVFERDRMLFRLENWALPVATITAVKTARAPPV